MENKTRKYDRNRKRKVAKYRYYNAMAREAAVRRMKEEVQGIAFTKMVRLYPPHVQADVIKIRIEHPELSLESLHRIAECFYQIYRVLQARSDV